MTTDTSEKGLESLICTALTGHPCDPTQTGAVREAASQLPEEADDQDLIDDGFPLTDDTGDNYYDDDDEAAEKPAMESEVTV